MALAGFTQSGTVFLPSAISAGGGGPVDDTYDSTTTSTNALEHKAIAGEFVRLIGGAPANSDTLGELATRIDTVAAGLEYIGTHDISTAAFPAQTAKGKMYSLIGATTTIGGTEYRAGQLLISNRENPSTTDPAHWDVIDLSSQLTALPLSSLTDDTSTQTGAISGQLLEQALNDWFGSKVDSTFDAASTSGNAIAHGAVATMRADLLGGVSAAGDTLNKIYNLVTALTTRVSTLEDNPLVSSGDSVPTTTTQSLIHLYTDPDLVTGGDESRLFYKLGGSWYGVLQPGDFSNN